MGSARKKHKKESSSVQASPSQAGQGVLLCLVLAVTFLAFVPTLNHSIAVWDDDGHLRKNEDVRSLSLSNIKRIFTNTVNATYIPLTTLSFALEYHFFKYKPFIYHFNNILLHLGVTALVFFFIKRCGASVRVAALAALIFGIHPMKVESVAWVTERKDVLYAFFYMLALHQYWSYLEEGRARPYMLSLVFGLLSILAKPMAVSLPLIFFVCDWMYRRRITWSMVVDKAGYFLYIIPIAWITYTQNARAVGHNLYDGSLTWIWTLVFYLRKFIFPLENLPIYRMPEPATLTSWHFFMPVITCLVIVYLLYRFRRDRLFIFSFAFFFFSIFFLLKYDQLDAVIVNDRFMYLPGMGFCYLLAYYGIKMFDWAKGRGETAKKAVVLFSILLGATVLVKTMQQNTIWKDDESLWGHLLKYRPESAMAHFGMGQVAYEQGREEEAFEHYKKSLAKNPNYAKANSNFGQMLYERGQEEQALEYFKIAIELDPDYLEAHNNYGAILSELGNHQAAKDYLAKMILQYGAVNKAAVILYISLGKIYYENGDLLAAEQILNESLMIAPDNASAYNRLGEVYMAQEKFDAAVGVFKKVIEIEPGYQKAVDSLNSALEQKKAIEEKFVLP